MLGINFNLLWATDIDVPCQRMLKYHFGSESTKIHGDVTALRVEDLSCPDVYIATPPCQSFSNAGKQLGTADAGGTLIHHPIKVHDLETSRAHLGECGKLLQPLQGDVPAAVWASESRTVVWASPRRVDPSTEQFTPKKNDGRMIPPELPKPQKVTQI
eukprot:6467906-Amphidinium_carterae.1